MSCKYHFNFGGTFLHPTVSKLIALWNQWVTISSDRISDSPAVSDDYLNWIRQDIAYFVGDIVVFPPYMDTAPLPER